MSDATTGLEIHACPNRWLATHRWESGVFAFWSSFWVPRGMLPGPGGLMDQPAALVEALRLLDGWLADYRADQAKRERERMNRKAAAGRMAR